MRRWASLLLCGPMSCVAPEAPETADSSSAEETDREADDTDDTELVVVVDTGIAPGELEVIGDWKLKSHRCSRLGSDSLTHDEAFYSWLGCGGDGASAGLWTSLSRGAIWEKAVTVPEHYFDEVMVLDSVKDDASAEVYLVGEGPLGRVHRIAQGDQPNAVHAEFPRTDEPWTWFVPSRIRVGSLGLAIAFVPDGPMAFRRGYEAVWEDGAGWLAAGQVVSDLVASSDVWVGAGTDELSRPVVHVNDDVRTPSGFPDDGLPVFTPLVLSEDEGPLQAVDVRDGRFYVAGRRRSDGMPRMWSSGEDVRANSDWTELDLTAALQGRAGSFRGLCLRGEVVVGVGAWEGGGAMVLRSPDRGVTWDDISPAGKPSVRLCRVGGGGVGTVVIIAGDAGLYGLHDPDDVWDPTGETVQH